jgi:hypothetical protein
MPLSTLANRLMATPGPTPTQPSQRSPADCIRTTDPTTISPSIPNGISRATIGVW